MTAPIFLSVLSTALVVLGLVALAGLILYRRYPLRLIHRSKQHLQWTFDSIDDPIAIIDANYCLLRVNKAYAAFVGRGFPGILGKKCFHALRGRNSPCTDCLMVNVLEKGQPACVEMSPHPGEQGSVSLTFYPYEARGTFDPAVVEHIRDTTALERLKRDLEAQNVSLRETTETLEKARVQTKEELDLARQIQLGIMPQHVPAIGGLKVASTYHPIGEVGGDIYDFIPFSRSRMGVFIGDASGHGLASAFIATISKMSLYNHTRQELPPHELLTMMNQDLLRNIQTGHYLTCFWGLIDMASHTLTYARAGHPHPLLITTQQQVVSLSAGGTFVGIIERPKYELKTVDLHPGDRLYLFTDGIYEVMEHGRDADPGVLGYQTFRDIVVANNFLPFEKIIAGIQQQLSRFTYEDDYTLIVIEIPDWEVA